MLDGEARALAQLDSVPPLRSDRRYRPFHMSTDLRLVSVVGLLRLLLPVRRHFRCRTGCRAPLGHDSFLVALRITRATPAHFRVDRVFQMADAAEEVPKCEVDQQHRQRDGDANRKECRFAAHTIL
jgi:hypothetical protein